MKCVDIIIVRPTYKRSNNQTVAKNRQLDIMELQNKQSNDQWTEEYETKVSKMRICVVQWLA